MLTDVPVRSNELASAEEMAALRWSDYWHVAYEHPLGSEDGGLHFSVTPVQVGVGTSGRRFEKRRLTGATRPLPDGTLLLTDENRVSAWLPHGDPVRELMTSRLPRLIDDPWAVFSALRVAEKTAGCAHGRLSLPTPAQPDTARETITIRHTVAHCYRFKFGDFALVRTVSELSVTPAAVRAKSGALSLAGYVEQTLLSRVLACTPVPHRPAA
ncbi:hypothetical protein F6X40_17195 [Paraburkholderia sp. UCT31]|uniref:hypothetical protein n=1 Tax=Paraburkholderia sp. UCT31 TaxID=2615209 RepID=UPI001655A76C|nr:hypothetical protein [Paraburkholderia sp. UCT31]MBC8738511.1 hypothetical protein [Paraburkholderia sp. UCT31]